MAEGAQPIDDGEFHGRGGRSAEPCSIKNVAPGGEGVGHGADEVVRAGDEGEEAWVIDLEVVGEDLAFEEADQFEGVVGGLRRWLVQPGMERLRTGARADGFIGEPGEVIDEEVHHAIAEGAHLVGRQFEERGGMHYIHIDRFAGEC